MLWTIAAIGVWMACCSAVSFLQYALDKARSRKAGRRIRERTLLLTALIGGWPGAILARNTLRHKTLKQPYRRLFALCIAGNLALIALVILAASQGLFGV